MALGSPQALGETPSQAPRSLCSWELCLNDTVELSIGDCGHWIPALQSWPPLEQVHRPLSVSLHHQPLSASPHVGADWPGPHHTTVGYLPGKWRPQVSHPDSEDGVVAKREHSPKHGKCV